MIWSDFDTIAAHRAPTAGRSLGEIEHRTRLFQEISAMQMGTGTFQASASEPDVEQVKSLQVSPNLLSLLGIHPALGRVFTSDERAGGRPAIVLSDSVWRRRFGGNPNIIGKLVRFNGGSFTVVGVLPEDFRLLLTVEIPWDIGSFSAVSILRTSSSSAISVLFARPGTHETGGSRRAGTTGDDSHRGGNSSGVRPVSARQSQAQRRQHASRRRARCPHHADRFVRWRRIRHADLLCQRRQFAAGARARTTQGNLVAVRPRSFPSAHPSPTADRGIHPLLRCGNRGVGVRMGSAAWPSAIATTGAPACRRDRSELARTWLRGRGVDCFGAFVRTGSSRRAGEMGFERHVTRIRAWLAHVFAPWSTRDSNRSRDCGRLHSRYRRRPDDPHVRKINKSTLGPMPKEYSRSP